MIKNLIIAFLIGMLTLQLGYAMKVPDIILSDRIDPDLKEIVEDYIVKIINENRYTLRVRASEVTSSEELDAGEFLMDDSGVTKYFVISNGTTNYRVQVTAI
jgi:hypothetical protein